MSLKCSVRCLPTRLSFLFRFQLACVDAFFFFTRVLLMIYTRFIVAQVKVNIRSVVVKKMS